MKGSRTSNGELVFTHLPPVRDFRKRSMIFVEVSFMRKNDGSRLFVEALRPLAGRDGGHPDRLAGAWNVRGVVCVGVVGATATREPILRGGRRAYDPLTAAPWGSWWPVSLPGAPARSPQTTQGPDPLSGSGP